jgi:predicted ester cyclase
MALEDTKAVSFKFMKSFDERDLEGCRALLGPGFRATMNGSPAMDAEAFFQTGKAFLDAFTEGRHEARYTVVEGDRAVTVLRWTAKHTGSFQGIPATGKTVSLEMVQSDRVANGKLIEHDGVFDVMTMMQQLGVVPQHSR